MGTNTRYEKASPAGMTRRTFLHTTAAAAAAYAFLPGCGASSAEVEGGIQGVRVGAISYSFRALPSSAEEILDYLRQTGLDTVELMGGPAEAFAGIPEAPPRPPRGADLSEAERAAYEEARSAYAAEARVWRLAAPMDRYEALRTMYNEAGVTIDILKLGSADWSDEEIDYAYNVARILGARGISFEAEDEAARRMGAFATKHQLYNGMHNHTQVADPDWSFDRLLSYSPYNALNFDIGHYVAGTGQSPIPIIEQYHDRITHLHLKDRKTPENGGDNVAWGEGDTPIGDVLRLIQREQYPISAMIELEYPIPDDSDVLTEVAKCVAYCRDALS